MKPGHLGMDLHGNAFPGYPRAEDGSGEGLIESLKAFVETVRTSDTGAVEVPGNGRLFRQALRERGGRIVGVNPHPFQGIPRSVKKTDEPEGQVLLEGRMKAGVHTRGTSLAQRRGQWGKLRTTLQNKGNPLLAARGILLRQASPARETGRAEVLARPVSELERGELEILVGEIGPLNESLKKLDGSLRDQRPRVPGWENLSSIQGIGEPGTRILLATRGHHSCLRRRGQTGGVLRHRARGEALQRDGAPRANPQGRVHTWAHRSGAVRLDRRSLPPLLAEVRSPDRSRQGHRPGDHRLGPKVPRPPLQEAEAPRDLRGLSSVRSRERLRINQEDEVNIHQRRR